MIQDLGQSVKGFKYSQILRVGPPGLLQFLLIFLKAYFAGVSTFCTEVEIDRYILCVICSFKFGIYIVVFLRSLLLCFLGLHLFVFPDQLLQGFVDIGEQSFGSLPCFFIFLHQGLLFSVHLLELFLHRIRINNDYRLHLLESVLKLLRKYICRIPECITHLVDEDIPLCLVLSVQLCQIDSHGIQVQRVTLAFTIQFTDIVKEMSEKLLFLRCIPPLSFTDFQKFLFCMKCFVKHGFSSFL